MFGPPKTRKTQTLLSKLYLKMMGWKVEGEVPDLPKFVVLFAPHTSGWDLPFMLAIAYALGIEAKWFGKKEIFRWPIGKFLKWLGGIPVDRDNHQNMVGQTVQLMNEHEQFIVGISPEGTRSKSSCWKTGFYYIAHEAGVPIVLAYLDYDRKAGGFGPVIETTGEIETDIEIIRSYYLGITPKYPRKIGEIVVKPRALT